jgi:hypothetical protein
MYCSNTLIIRTVEIDSQRLSPKSYFMFQFQFTILLMPLWHGMEQGTTTPRPYFALYSMYAPAVPVICTVSIVSFTTVQKYQIIVLYFLITGSISGTIFIFIIIINAYEL